MKRKPSFFSSNKFLAVLILLSVLMIALGLWFNRNISESNVSLDAVSRMQEIPLPPLPVIDKSRPANLSSVQAALKSMSEGVIPSNHGLTQDDIIKAIAETTPGSESWCDLLLLKDENGWLEDEVIEFSRSCI